MNEFKEFHHRQTTSNRTAQLTIGAVILALVAGFGIYANNDEPARPHSAVPDNHLPSLRSGATALASAETDAHRRRHEHRGSEDECCSKKRLLTKPTRP